MNNLDISKWIWKTYSKEKTTTAAFNFLLKDIKLNKKKLNISSFMS